MKLYCGTYAKYNEGSLKGEWVDLDNFSNADDFLFSIFCEKNRQKYSCKRYSFFNGGIDHIFI